jgi:hypothetical protein
MRWLITAVLILCLSPLSAAADGMSEPEERPVIGVVKLVNPHTRTIVLGPMEFHVPGDVFDLDELSVGMQAVVRFTRTEEGLVATSVVPDLRPR